MGYRTKEQSTCAEALLASLSGGSGRVPPFLTLMRMAFLQVVVARVRS